jgi:polysaccharide biosynthesis/export protein
MTPLSRPVSPFILLRALAAFGIGLLAGHAQAADETGGGTFNTPTYAPSSAASAPTAGPTTPSPRGLSPSTNGAGMAGARGTEAQRREADPSRQGLDTPSRRIELAPARPGEFQKFVEGATGRSLPVFGASFFVDAANSLATVENVPVSSDYTLGTGDEVLIRAWGAIDADFRAVVDRNGQVNLPKVGAVTVAGVRASELERHLRAQIGRLYTNFNLSVALGQLRGVKVFVVGPARVPGVYTVSSQGTMLSAVVAAGGPGPNGSMRRVQLKRNGVLVSELDIYDFLVQGDKSKDVQLIAGDVVVFLPAGPRVALSGALDVPGIYELKAAQESLREVLRYAGGAAVLTNPHQVLVERIDASRTPAARYVEEIRLDEAGLQRPLRDGDVLTLLPISPQFANAVTLKGHVAQPLRYAFKPGMRIRDLIPSKDALVTPDFYRRKNLLVQSLDDEEPDEEVLADGSSRPTSRNATNGTLRRSAAERARRTEDRNITERAKKAPAALFDELNWDYAVIERLNADLSTQVIPFNLGKAVLMGDEASNIELMAGDVVTVYSQKDMKVPVAKQTRLVSVEGEVGAPGVYQLLPGETLPQLIARAGGFTPQAYVYGLEFTREETRKRQRENLAEAMARLEALAATQGARDAANRRDDAADRSAAVNAAATQAQLTRLSRVQPTGRIALELEPGDTLASLPTVPLDHADRIVVPARPGFITVAGAVVNNNALLWKPNRTVGDYLRQAGLDEAAEKSNMFVLRADGTVMHAGDRRGFFGSRSIESQVVQPGDAIVVPTQLDFETWGRALVRNLKDFSQIFYQFGLGAAAIETLRKN